MSIVREEIKTGVNKKTIQNFIYDKSDLGISKFRKLLNSTDKTRFDNMVQRTKDRIVKNSGSRKK